MKNFSRVIKSIFMSLPLLLSGIGASFTANAVIPGSDPLFLSSNAEPLVMLAMSNDHQLYHKAYTDFDDVDGDNLLDTTYKDTINYYGYFDSKKCYGYNTGSGGFFEPKAAAAGANSHFCDAVATGRWSGNFLNWAAMTRMDVLRKVLYGGYRSTDTATLTVLERAFIPTDNHAWTKLYSVNDIDKYTPYTIAANPQGITMCNVSPMSGTDRSENSTATPRLRVAKGQWPSWAAQESRQCLWNNEFASAEGASPDNTTQKLDELTVRVKACDSTLVVSENCKTYGTSLKPVGLLQDFADADKLKIRFGLMTGSYGKRKSGGVLRKNIARFTDEVNATNGIFTGVDGIVTSINRMRISRYEYAAPGYGNAPAGTTFGTSHDNCPFGQNTWDNADSGLAKAGCSNWGNPMGEIFLETLRYFVGGQTPNFSANDTAWIAGLTEATWRNPYGAAMTNPVGGGNPWCAKPNVIVISTGVLAFDNDEYAGAANLPGLNVNTETDRVGTGEGVNGNNWYVGSLTGWSANDVCSSQTVNNLSSVTGICPEAAGLQGSFKIAGLAYYAHKATTVLQSVPGNNSTTNNVSPVDTYAVALAAPIPSIKVPIGTSTVTIIPAGYQWRNNNAMILVNFQVISQTATDGEFFMNYENAPAGSDYDNDMKGYLRYIVTGNTIKVIMHQIGSSAGATQVMGYVIDGVTDAGTHYLVSNNNLLSNTQQGGGTYTTTKAAIDTACGGAGFAADPTTAAGTPTPELCHYNFSGSDRYMRGVKKHTVGTAATGLLKSPLWYAAKWGGFRDTDTSGTPNTVSEWDRKNLKGQTVAAGDGNPDNYFPVTNAAQLEEALTTAFNNIIKTSGTAAAVAVNTASVSTETAIYQSKFTAGVWSGQVLAKSINTNTGQVSATAVWDAADQLRAQDWRATAPDGRQIITWNPNLVAARKGAAFQYSQIGATNQGYLSANQVDFLRGDNSNEGTLRDRDDNGLDFKLGDIVNSAPIFVGTPPFLYRDSLEPTAPYSAFRTAYANRMPIVYVGANDGMLHGFNACADKVNPTAFPGCDNQTAKFGNEKIAYVPSTVYPILPDLTDVSYTHRFYVDLTPTVGDVYGNFGATNCSSGTSCWRTVLVGGLRGGGTGYFALDVTDPTQFTEANASKLALWEFTHADLGYSFSEPTITKMHDGSWAVIFGSGYSDATHGSNKAALFVVNAVTGALIAEIVLDNTGSNGLATPLAVDTDSDFIADLIYAGDLKGNVWKIDVRDPNPANWASFYKSGTTPQPLFKAVDASGNAQPITARPDVGRHPDGQRGYMVYVGTGKYIEAGDNIAKASPVNTMYGLWDKDPTSAPFTTPIGGRSQLLQQTITSEFTSGTETFRTLSSNAISWDGVGSGTHKGWYMDLNTAAAADLGEMIVFKPQLRSTRVIFTTLIPQVIPCQPGGDGFLMELDYRTGGVTSFDVFDLNNDGSFNSQDRGGQSNVVNGRKTGLGVTPDPTIIDDPGKGRELKITTGSSGVVQSIANNPGPTDPPTGRRSWRQLK